MDLSKDRAPNLKIVDILFISLALISCILRCYTRLFVVRAFGSDDWLMMVAMSFYTLYIISGFISVKHGSGRHQDTLTEHDLAIAMKHWWLCYFWYCFCMVFARLSIGIFFLRLTAKVLHRYLIYLIMFSTVAFGFIFIGVAIGECTPPAYFWDKTIEGGWCMSDTIIVALMYLYSSSSLFSDATYAVFPIFLMHGLQMEKKTKYALIPILGLGWIASIAVLIRFGFITTLASDDFTYDALTIAILSSAEQGLAITAGNLATLRPLFTRKFRLWGSYIKDSSAGVHNPSGVGAAGRAKGRAGSDAEVGLATFLERRAVHDDDPPSSSDGDGDSSENKGIHVTTNIAVTTHGEAENWGLSKSQGNLHTKPSRSTLDEEEARPVPASFLTKGVSSRHSGGT